MKAFVQGVVYKIYLRNSILITLSSFIEHMKMIRNVFHIIRHSKVALKFLYSGRQQSFKINVSFFFSDSKHIDIEGLRLIPMLMTSHVTPAQTCLLSDVIHIYSKGTTKSVLATLH